MSPGQGSTATVYSPALSVAHAPAPPGAGARPAAHDTAAQQLQWSQTGPPVSQVQHSTGQGRAHNAKPLCEERLHR
jgi:hypothetical protein